MLRRLFNSRMTAKLSPPVLEPLQMMLAGEMRLVSLRRTAKTQRYTLRLKLGTRQLVVTMPPRGTICQARIFLNRHENWLQARLNALPEKIQFKHRAIIPFQGEMYTIVRMNSARGTTCIDTQSDSPVLRVSGNEEHVSRRVTDFLKRSAKEKLTKATYKYAAQLDVSIKRITIKDTTSRWGSCSSQGAIAYSWRIIMAPDYVLDYLAAHEVAHRREMNHSSRFWTLLRNMCSETDRAEAWLKKHGQSLHEYG